MRSFRAFFRSLFMAAIVTSAACGSDGVAGPDDDLRFLVGDWEADVLVVSDPTNTAADVDLIAAGATFRINVQPSGAYTATLTAGVVPFTEIGSLEVDGNQITFYRDFPSADTATGTLTQLSPDRIRLLGETRFDFDSDGTAEDADLLTELVRQ